MKLIKLDVLTQTDIKNRIKYPLIVSWHKGSCSYYITDICQKAANESAPFNAIYKDSAGLWRTIDQCSEDNRQSFIESHYKKAVSIASQLIDQLE